VLIAHTKDRYLRTPRLVANGSGATLYAIAWRPSAWEAGEDLVAIDLDASGSPTTDARVREHRAAIVGLEGGVEPPRVTDDVTAEERHASGEWRVTVAREGYLSSVIASGPPVDEVLVWRAFGTASAPCVAPAAGGGAWVAFHHNVREDTGAPDLVKWIALYFVDDRGRVHSLPGPLLELDRDRLGEEQGFEFPSLVVAADGAVALFGRGSHRFYRQDLSAEGCSPRSARGPEGWGCRGRRVAVVAIEGGAILTARREREGIVIDREPAPTGGAPALRPVGPETRSNDASQRAEVSAKTTGDFSMDPALRDARRTLFGDLHQHSAHSDGCGVADEGYLRARHIYADDFCALTDHESFLGKRIGPGEWEYLERVAERHHAPGRFATLLAYEWTSAKYPGPGHKIVYLPRPGAPIVSRDDVPEGHALLEAVRALGGLAAPHHIGWTGADAPAHDPVVQPVWEICSCHGCYETADHPLGQRGELRDQVVSEMLRAGLRFGFIACSDGHGLLWHHGVARKRDPFRTGLTAVHATECSREAILAAIRERRCYATSGPKIYLDLRAGGAPMGTELASDAAVRVRAEATGAGPIARIELVGPDGVVATAAGEGDRAEIEVESLAARYVYARVTQVDGEMAWSSPIWWP